MRLYAGTSGFSYKEWKGAFYPPELKDGEMLAYYAQRLGAVEVNNTFYRIPKRDVLQRWVETVGDGFQFVIKASQRITHRARLREAAYESLDYLWQQCGALGEKLGPLLFQCPPEMKLDLDRLQRFLERMPAEMQAAFEFRHPSWKEPQVLDALAERGCAWCSSESSEDAGELVVTGDWGYLRLRREDYTEGDLRAWAARIIDQPWNRVYCFFKHEEVPNAPRYAREFGQAFARRLIDVGQ